MKEVGSQILALVEENTIVFQDRNVGMLEIRIDLVLTDEEAVQSLVTKLVLLKVNLLIYFGCIIVIYYPWLHMLF